MLSGRLLGPLNQLVGTWRTYASFKESVERLGQVFNTPSERTESEVKLDRPARSPSKKSRLPMPTAAPRLSTTSA